MIMPHYQPYHDALMTLAGKNQGKLKLGKQIMITAVQHQDSVRWPIPLNREFELRDSIGRLRGSRTFLIPIQHGYLVETPRIKEDIKEMVAQRIEETIKKHLFVFRKKLPAIQFLRMAVDVQPVNASAIRKGRTLWQVIISELVDPNDIPDST